jgi:hypothetical protein
VQLGIRDDVSQILALEWRQSRVIDQALWFSSAITAQRVTPSRHARSRAIQPW